jgi:hypothetical protein
MSDDAHDHSAHADDGHHADAGHGHGDEGPKFPFGEVIPEKNWQENFVVFCAVVCLVGLVWLFSIWITAPLSAVAEMQEHSLGPEHAGAPGHAAEPGHTADPGSGVTPESPAH